MKTILVLTDFSINADYVAQYALELAKKIEASLLICNIYDMPADEAENRNAWPLPACEKNSIYDLEEIVARLKTSLDSDYDTYTGYRPEIEQCSEAGLPGQSLSNIISKHDIQLAMISVHNSKNISGFFKKDHAWDIIDNAAFPVMLIPYQLRYKFFKKIAFASAINLSDTASLKSVAALAKYTDSEILISHVNTHQKEESYSRQFFNQALLKLGYPKIIYHQITGSNVVNSLKELCAHIDIDLLVLVHHKHSLLQKLFGSNVTRKMANNPDKPLLIFPAPLSGK